MSTFVPRSEFDPNPKAPARYLDPIRPAMHDLLRLVQQQMPDGEDYTLYALAGLGEARTAALAGGDLDKGKKAVGYFVAVELARLFVPSKVFSERDQKGNARSRKNVSGVAPWVTSYTRHRVQL